MDRETFEKGMSIRRAVLGADYVDKAMASADDFNRPMQELTTQYCWGEIWGRPGLDRRTRSIINLAMISALNRPHELKIHVKGALNNGLSKDDIREPLLQRMRRRVVLCDRRAASTDLSGEQNRNRAPSGYQNVPSSHFIAPNLSQICSVTLAARMHPLRRRSKERTDGGGPSDEINVSCHLRRYGCLRHPSACPLHIR